MTGKGSKVKAFHIEHTAETVVSNLRPVDLSAGPIGDRSNDGWRFCLPRAREANTVPKIHENNLPIVAALRVFLLNGLHVPIGYS
jgi:hypothetical protein